MKSVQEEASCFFWRWNPWSAVGLCLDFLCYFLWFLLLCSCFVIIVSDLLLWRSLLFMEWKAEWLQKTNKQNEPNKQKHEKNGNDLGRPWWAGRIILLQNRFSTVTLYRLFKALSISAQENNFFSMQLQIGFGLNFMSSA